MNRTRFTGGVFALVVLLESGGSGLARAALLPPLSVNQPLYIFQDIHANREAQNDIAGGLRRLQLKLGGPLRVGVEGAAGRFDFSLYRAFPDLKLLTRVGQQFLDAEKIT